MKLPSDVPSTTDPAIIAEKSQDLTSMSPELGYLSSLRADAVVFPRNEDDVLKVVELALEEHVPLVPRGAGRNNIGGVVPLRGGIIVDTSNMKKYFNQEKKFVCQPGVKYFENRMTFNARIYPSTFRDGVTVGGNFEGGCGGIGAFRYNRVWYQAEYVRLVNPRGKIEKLTADDVKVAAHAEGTTGIVTELAMLKKEWNRDIPITLAFNSVEDAVEFVTRAYDENYPIYSMTLRSPKASRIMEEETGVPEGGWYVIISLPEDESIEIPRKARTVNDNGRLWERRDLFFGGLIWFYWKRFGRLFYITRDLQVENLAELLNELKDMNLTIQVEFLRGGVAHPFLVTLNKDDFERSKHSIYRFPGRNFDLHDIRINGRLDKDHIQKILTYKRAYDKEDLFNPGKVYFTK